MKQALLAITLLLCINPIKSNDSEPRGSEKFTAFMVGCLIPWSSFRNSCTNMLTIPKWPQGLLKKEFYFNDELKSYQDWQARCKEVGTLADPNKKNQKLFFYYNQGNTARRVGLLASTILAKRERSQAIAGSLWILEFFFSVNK